MRKVMNVGFVLENNKLLLGLKKRGFGQGKWNGFGGKVKEGETITAALAREFEEECSLMVHESEQFGLIDFSFEGDPAILEVHFFRITKYSGTPKESEEMKPAWFATTELPFQHMWPDDKHWMSIFLAGKKFKGKIHYKDQSTIISADVNEVKEL